MSLKHSILLLFLSLSALGSPPEAFLTKEISLDALPKEDAQLRGSIGNPLLVTARKQLTRWIREKRNKVLWIEDIETAELKKRASDLSETEIKRHFDEFEKNQNKEEKACFLSGISTRTSSFAVVIGLRNLKISERRLKRLYSKDENLDGSGSRIRDYLIEKFFETKCGRTHAFLRLDRLDVIECDLTPERIDEQIKDASEMLRYGKPSREEEALVQLNLGLQYTYAFYVSPIDKSEHFRKLAIEAYRKVSELFPETRKLSAACIEGLTKEIARDLGSCIDTC